MESSQILAAALPAQAAAAPLESSQILILLLLGGVMGLLGQGARTVIGLKGMTDDARALDVSPNDLFQAARLLTSLMIGTLVGVASALVYLASAGTGAAVDWHTLIGFAAAGYAGADFLEGFISTYLQPPVQTNPSLLSAARASHQSLREAQPIATALTTSKAADNATNFVIGILNRLRGGNAKPLPANDPAVLKLSLAALGWNDAGSDEILASINKAKWHGVKLPPGSINSSLTIQQIIDAVTAQHHS